MRHYCIALVSCAATSLAGCGMESSGSSAFNPATNVALPFSTFDLENTQRAPDNLEHTRFWDFYRGIEPVDEDPEDATTVEEIRAHIDVFIRATRDASGSAYERVRNPLDLINQVIASGEVTNFQEGKRYIAQRIAAGVAGNYNSRANGAQIQFTDHSAVHAAAPVNDQLWVYPTLDWRYLPDGPDGSNLEDKVYRTIQYVARSVPEADQDAQPELVSLLAGSRFNANAFVELGYNTPEYATVDYLSRNHGSIELRQDFVDNVDTLFIKSSEQVVLTLNRYDGVNLDDQSPDCLRVDMDYWALRVRIFASNGEPSTIDAPTDDDPDNTEPNPAYCGNQEAGDALVSWNADDIERRQ